MTATKASVTEHGMEVTTEFLRQDFSLKYLSILNINKTQLTYF